MEAWAASVRDIGPAAFECAPDPVAAVVRILLEASTPVQGEAKWKLDVAFTQSGSPELARADASTEELVRAYVKAKESAAETMATARDTKKILEKKREEAERKLLPELAASESASTVRRINVRDAVTGSQDAFFLRVKPPRIRPIRPMGLPKYKNVLRTAAEQSLARFEVDRFRASDVVPSQEFAEDLKERLGALLLCYEENEGAVATPGEPRIALDHIPSARSATC
jgi:hypothetical protein